MVKEIQNYIGTENERIVKAFEDDITNLVIIETEKEFGGYRYAFQKISSADIVRGDVTKDAVVYVGESRKYYPRDDGLDDVPRNVIRKVAEDYTLLTDVDAGWKNWAGRPEFDESKTYADVSDAKIIGDEQ